MKLIWRAAAAALVLGVLGRSGPASAQNAAKADTLYQEGIKRLESREYKDACPILKHSYDLDPSAGTLFALADCHAYLGEAAKAMGYYEAYLTMVRGMPAEKQAKQEKFGRVARAKSQMQILRPKVSHVLYLVPDPMPEGTRVEQDGEELNTNSLSGLLLIDPGEHGVRVVVPGKEPLETRYSVEKGESKTVRLEFPAAAGGDSWGGFWTTKPSNMRIGTYVAGGVGILGLGLGTVLGGVVLSRSDELLERCPRTGENLVCKHEEHARTLEQTQTLGTVSTVGFVVGGAALAGAVVLWLLEPRTRKVGASDRHIQVDIMSVGSKGTLVGLRGAW